MDEYQDALDKIVLRKVPPGENAFQYVFLVGAGASVASGIPDGRQMCKSLEDTYKIHEDDILKRREKHPGLTRYQAIMSLVQDHSTDRWISQYIRDLIRRARRPQPDCRWIINNCYDTIANIFIEKPEFSRVVATTNFDPLLYYAFIQNWHDEPVLIRHPDEVATMRPAEVVKEFPTLLYLHGYWQNHSQYNQAAQIIDYANRWHGRLESLSSHDVIVVGYSGLEDSIASRWLRECLQKGSNRIWWCVYSPEQPLRHDLVQPIQQAMNYYHEDRLRFIPISSADRFLLDLGAKLGLSRATDIACATRVFGWFQPSALSYFANGASLRYETSRNLDVTIRTGGDPYPGNNHAGLNIDTVIYEKDLNGYEAIEVRYSVRNAGAGAAKGTFEFKLHSDTNAWSYHLPFAPAEGVFRIPLEEFRRQGVNLSRIWRLVLAADVNCLGADGEALLSIENTSLV